MFPGTGASGDVQQEDESLNPRVGIERSGEEVESLRTINAAAVGVASNKDDNIKVLGKDNSYPMHGSNTDPSLHASGPHSFNIGIINTMVETFFFSADQNSRPKRRQVNMKPIIRTHSRCRVSSPFSVERPKKGKGQWGI
ncbi:hypothetical protein Hanom_Chr03g00276191 [Helianthus anomalus]